MVNPCLILGCNSLDKIAGETGDTKKYRAEPFSDHWSTFMAPNLPKPLIDIPKMSVRIDCTAPKLMLTSLAMFRRSRLLSHVARVCTTLTFALAVASLGRPDRLSSSTLSLPLFNSAAHVLLWNKKETPSQGFP